MTARRRTRPGTTGWSLAMAAVLAHVVMTVAAGAIALGRDAGGAVICSAMGLRVLDGRPGDAGRPDRLSCYLCPACQTPTVTAAPPAAAPAIAAPLARPAEVMRPHASRLPDRLRHRPGAPRGPPPAV